VNFLPAYRPSRLMLILLAVVAAIAGTLALLASQPGAARASTVQSAVTSHGRAKPTIVLVHGAWADSSGWDAVVGRLQRLGYTVDVPPNPLRGVQQDSAYLRDFLSTVSGPVILVGHSYGGTVITNAATGDSQVKALVYVDAFLPATGETLQELNSAKPGSCVASSSVLNQVPYPGAKPGDFDTYIKQSWFPGCFANGLPAAEGARIAAEQRPLAASTLTEPSGVPAWKTIPSWAVVGTADKVIVPAEQLAMAKRAHARITEVKAPHLSMVSDPGAVTRAGRSGPRPGFCARRPARRRRPTGRLPTASADG
jgi:pimeloyl-ACP methyl ester carboxylesterase